MLRIGVIGAGVVGQATGKGLAHYGHKIVFCDANPARVEDLQQQGYFAVSPNDFIQHRNDATMICVGTPTNAMEIDLSHLRSACQLMASILQLTNEYHLVVVRSTLPPGTTQDLVIPLLEEGSGKLAGQDFGVCYNPEFLREVSALDDFVTPWVIVLGANDTGSERAARQIYEPISSRLEMPVTVTNLRSAEMIKYAHNLYNATKISYTNEIWSVCQDLSIDGDLVMSTISQSAEAMWNPNYGIKGGFPYGGSCLPKDTVAFLAFAEEHGLEMKLLDAVVQVNEQMDLRKPNQEKSLGLVSLGMQGR